MTRSVRAGGRIKSIAIMLVAAAVSGGAARADEFCLKLAVTNPIPEVRERIVYTTVPDYFTADDFVDLSGFEFVATNDSSRWAKVEGPVRLAPLEGRVLTIRVRDRFRMDPEELADLQAQADGILPQAIERYRTATNETQSVLGDAVVFLTNTIAEVRGEDARGALDHSSVEEHLRAYEMNRTRLGLLRDMLSILPRLLAMPPDATPRARCSLVGGMPVPDHRDVRIERSWEKCGKQ